nr:MAG: hypothetical protein CM15mP61_12320 [Gammaproteobacteria bacterium]
MILKWIFIYNIKSNYGEFMRIILVLSMFLLVACNMEVDVQINGEK